MTLDNSSPTWGKVLHSKCRHQSRWRCSVRTQGRLCGSDIEPPLSVCTGAEGKAGMAAIADPSHSSDLEKLVKDMEKALPPYARPVFLRFLPEVNKTGKMLFSLLVV